MKEFTTPVSFVPAASGPRWVKYVAFIIIIIFVSACLATSLISLDMLAFIKNPVFLRFFNEIKKNQTYNSISFALPIVTLSVLSICRTGLVIDKNGIHFKVNKYLKFLRILDGSNDIKWSDLGYVIYIEKSKTLKFHCPEKPLSSCEVYASYWSLTHAEKPIQPLAAPIIAETRGITTYLTKWRATAPQKQSEPDLVRVLREHDIFTEFQKDKYASERTTVWGFDLLSNPVSLSLVIVFFSCIVYDRADTVLQQEAWAAANIQYFLPHIAAGLISTLALGLWLTRGKPSEKLTKGITVSLTCMLGLTLGITSYIAGIRINQALGMPLTTASYTRNASCTALIPDNKDYPVIEYTKRTQDYLCSLNSNQRIDVSVRQGLFGLYQINLDELTNSINDYNQTRCVRPQTS